MSDFGLRGYQEEVVARALRGENIIICLPTGGGKTRAAVYVAKRHLDTNPEGKVMVLVNKVHLVDQHYSKEFMPHLGRQYRVVAVSGECDEKDFFGNVVRDSDMIICTAQILENALINTEDSKHVKLSESPTNKVTVHHRRSFPPPLATDITLLIIDECHHTHKEEVYNKIMRRYVEKKVRGERPLPQILGLMALPGTGGARTLEKAVEHVLQICANLDSAIVSSKLCVHELKEKVPRPVKRFDIVDQRHKDPLRDHLRQMMERIHDFMGITSDITLRETGTQEYETDVVLLEQHGVREDNRLLAQCALHLRQYNDALLINDTLRMMDAYTSLADYYNTKVASAIDGTDRFLLALFQENKTTLKTIARDTRFENPKMDKLQSILLKQFGPSTNSKGIIFSKTRKSIHCLQDWVLSNLALQEAGIKAATLTGSGSGISYMTQGEQKETIQKFRKGNLNLLISTSVAEEGLDIPECNLVVRYGLLTNEIAQQQASGRARARDSVYSVVAQAGGREVRRELTNEYLEELTDEALSKVQSMSYQEFRAKITKLQEEEVLRRQLMQNLTLDKKNCYSADNIQLLCRNCFKPVASGSDIKLVDNSHYVNVNPKFAGLYKRGGQVFMERSFEDWEPGCTINCGKCGKHWGCEMKYKKVALLPNLAIKEFALQIADKRMTVKKWKNVPFTVNDLNFSEYCKKNFLDLSN
ncbi:probable ATP-dependent RNA helicase DHX58 isoform X2 [Lampris incognitus]|uniref:probable ATP-dependent RNA helicase DHX58 isoform X2 n=1 Tax=Lampris incognitus TaxID=2546036 RepID=UPI0024B5EA50|nr:probable ATP-dependent RNA helicase DHX58 isoform X2 [Lampris incognitus]